MIINHTLPDKACQTLRIERRNVADNSVHSTIVPPLLEHICNGRFVYGVKGYIWCTQTANGLDGHPMMRMKSVHLEEPEGLVQRWNQSLTTYLMEYGSVYLILTSISLSLVQTNKILMKISQLLVSLIK